jgi:hypothetical protein
MNDPKWDCALFETETPNIDKLPESVKTASLIDSFSKIAKELFNPMKTPPVPAREIQKESIQVAKMDKMRGMTPVEYRNKMTASRTGVMARNRRSNKAA